MTQRARPPGTLEFMSAIVLYVIFLTIPAIGLK